MEYIPDPYVFAILLTMLAFAGALGVGAGPVAALEAWSDGLWVFLTFMAQFAVILMTGDAIAKSPTVTRVLRRIAAFPIPTDGSDGLGRLVPEGRFHATAFVSFVAMVGALISWGIGLIAGAVMARQVAYQARENGVEIHYPLLAAAGYTGLMIWHSGLTSSSALLMATPSSLPESFLQYTPNGLPISATIGSTVNLVTVALLLVVIPPVLGFLHPKDSGEVSELPDPAYRKMMPDTGDADPTGIAETVDDPDAVSSTGVETDGGVEAERRTAADRLNDSVLLTLLIVGFPAFYIVDAWILSGGGISSLTLNSINAFFLLCAIVLWRTPAGIVGQMEESAENIAGIIFQFPFYAGISGLLTGTALATVISNFFASFATPLTWPVIGMVSAGIMNVFVPSGGGQWVAQGPILLDTTKQLGMPLYTAVLIEMMGDQLTNMIQPFWAIPLLALTDLRARDIIGYTMVAMLAGFAIMGTTMTLMLGVL